MKHRKKHLNYSNYLREVMPEVNRSVRLPASLHFASIIEEYLLLVKHRCFDMLSQDL